MGCLLIHLCRPSEASTGSCHSGVALRRPITVDGPAGEDSQQRGQGQHFQNSASDSLNEDALIPMSQDKGKPLVQVLKYKRDFTQSIY